MDRLTRGERILGISALLLLILSFIPMWAKYEVNTGGLDVPGLGDTSDRFSAWSDALPGWYKLALILTILTLIVVAIRAAGNTELPFPSGLLYLIGAGLVALLTLVVVITGPQGESAEAFGVGFEVSRGPLMFVGLLLSLAMAYGAWMHYQGEQAGGTTMGGTMGGTPPTTPPPPAS